MIGLTAQHWYALGFYVGPLTIFGDIPTLLALADSLVAAAWTLKTAADAAAAPFTPADPEQAAEG